MAPITGVPIIDWFLALLDSWGYLLVTIFTVIENLFVIGSFTPGETMVIAAAFLTTPGQGHLSLPIVWMCSVLGTVTGSNLSYLFGRRGGRDALLKYGRRFRVTEEKVAAAEAYFFLHGSKTVMLSRFAAGFKNFVPVLAGVSKMPLLYFEGWTLLGAITYTSLMCAVGYFLGENFDRALTVARGFTYFGLVLFLIVLGLALYGRYRFIQRRRQTLEEYAEEFLAADDGDDA